MVPQCSSFINHRFHKIPQRQDNHMTRLKEKRMLNVRFQDTGAFLRVARTINVIESVHFAGLATPILFVIVPKQKKPYGVRVARLLGCVVVRVRVTQGEHKSGESDSVLDVYLNPDVRLGRWLHVGQMQSNN